MTGIGPSTESGPESVDRDTVLVAGDASSRLVGHVIDSALLTVASLLLLGVLGVVHGKVVVVRGSGRVADRVEIDSARFAIDTSLVTLLAAAYFAGSWVRRGATIGQRLVGLDVRSAGSDARVTPVRAIVRFVALGAPFWIAASLVSGGARLAMWGLGGVWYLMLLGSVAWGSATTGLHDRLARTFVVRRVAPLGDRATRANRRELA